MKYIVAIFTLLFVPAAQSAGATSDANTQPQVSQQDIITKELNRCLNLPSAAEVEPYRIVLNVVFDEHGTVKDVTALDYTKGGVGKVAVLAYTRALERCSPFKNVPHGSLELTFTSNPQTGAINPFK